MTKGLSTSQQTPASQGAQVATQAVRRRRRQLNHIQRARLSAHALRRSPRPRCPRPSSGQQQPPPDAGRRSAERELRSLLGSTKVRQILEELDKLPQFQMPKPNCRKWLLREEHGTECAEIYSPPRVTHFVREMGFRAACSLDLTIVDPIDGMPWDFSFEAKRKRAGRSAPCKASTMPS